MLKSFYNGIKKKGRIPITSANSHEVEEFYNPRIARFQALKNHLKQELKQAYTAFDRKDMEREPVKLRIDQLEEQILGVQERIDVLEKLKRKNSGFES